ncbi:dGTP triphosphohydrolase [Pseudodonghicola flavimaris]|uniref:DNTP triphosphohydrolase n=1 Tax=Pseudodonghicola flavimaris TaxID=3050036 RepID=A0ABT7F6I8_9RHOB|nr:dNTP triphosphohydrolase [Pseudodonghicola flavimaris]MDK3020218.1 dNTP triphosphohydrolase [Pseudodonghicola flavimaris]
MEWEQLLNPGRLCRPDYAEKPGRPAYLQDYDRILFSQPFRRLAQKTQVHPLVHHDHLHHRMIHSMETSSVGRSLGIAVGQRLVDDGKLPDGQQHVIAGVVQAACLMHDIGNPPFGHAGEDAIGEWFEELFERDEGRAAAIGARRAEFSPLEGNAQGFRIATALEMGRQPGGMQLSYATLGAFMKYPCTAAVSGATPYVGLKKFGVFETEAALFAETAAALGLPQRGAGPGPWWARHPLAFLVEAADDICYRILDLEDAATIGDLTPAQAIDILDQIAQPKRAMEPGMTDHEGVALRRAMAIGAAIGAAVDAFVAHYEEIMAGTFSDGLMEVSTKARAFAELKDISNARIFTARRKTELEIAGRQVLRDLLDHFHGLFAALEEQGWEPEALKGGYWEKLIRATDIDLRGVVDDYTALHALADFVSGMTDRYAVRTRDMIAGRVG